MGFTESPIRKKSFEFACEIVFYCDVLKKNKDFELASQLLKAEQVLERIHEKLNGELVKKILKISLVFLSKKLTKPSIG